MSGISSVGSSSSISSAYTNSLDKNGDGVVDAEELQEAAQSGLLSASIFGDENDSDPSAADKFSDSLAAMLLQMQQNGASQATGGGSSDASSDQSPMDALFSTLDANGDGKVSSDEFVAGRPEDMSEDDAKALFKSIDTQNAGALDKDQFAEGLDALKSTDQSAADVLSLESDAAGTGSDTSNATDQNPLDTFLAEIEASMNAYQNTYGQYDLDSTDALSA